jgi:hypothetical protein
MTGAERAALKLCRELLEIEAESRERDARRRQDRLDQLDPAGDTYKEEQYEIAFAKGEATGLRAARNRLVELLDSFDRDGAP